MAIQHFFLQQPNPDEGHVFFCNLVGDPWCPEATAVGRGMYMNGRVIAHDLLEHTQYHRKRTYVPWTEELKAFGTAVYIRGSEIEVQSDFVGAVEGITQAIVDVPEVPYTYRALCRDNPVGLDVLKVLQDYDESYHDDIRNIADQINYGYLMRMDSNYPYTYTDFRIVEDYFQEFEMPYYAKRQYFTYCPDRQVVKPTLTLEHL